MDRYNSVLPTKGYSGDIGARKRVQLPSEQIKGSQSGLPYGSSSMYHSTPVSKTAVPMSTTMASSYMKPRTTNSLYNPSSAIPSLRTSRSKSPIRNTSPIGTGTRRSISPRRGTSPSRLCSGSPLSPGKQASDVDTDTIQRQRRELQLLIGELKDRDRELNDMVQSHQKQIVAWEEDRQRVLSLEKRCSRLESELKNKNGQIKANQARLKAAEAEEKTKTKELEDTQVQLQQVSEQANTSIHQLQDLEEKNISLTNTMRELSNTIGQLQAREQELTTRLKLKDNDITEANVRIGELQQKIRRLEGLCQELKKADATLKTERDQWKDQALANKNEIEKLRGDISKQFSDADEIQAECGQVKQEVLVLQKELFLAGEREKRKDQLLELQKSKQERTDAELQNIRQICDRQQRDISFLQMQIHSNQESFMKSDDLTNDAKIGDYYEEKINYNLNPEYDNQDAASTKSLDFDDNVVPYSLTKADGLTKINVMLDDETDGDLTPYLPAKGLTPMSNYATVGSEFSEDLESVSHEPLPTLTNDRPFTSTAMPDSYGSDPRQQQYYGAPPNKPDIYPAFGGLTISGTKPDVESIDGDGGNYMPYSIGADLTSTATGPPGVPMNGFSHSTASPQGNHQAEESSPTSKLHRLLAESRQMVQNLEQVSTFAGSSSPKQDGTQGVDQFTPPQRHLGSPLTNHIQSKSQGSS